MGLANRARNLLRAYIGREWERIESIRERSAREELDQFLGKAPPPVPQDAAVRAEPQMTPEEREIIAAYRVLGLDPGADLQDVRSAYKRLSERSLPANFPEGSEERRKAAQIHLSVQAAYDKLLPHLDPRLKRFQSLDIE